MRRIIIAVSFLTAFWCGDSSFAAAQRFIQVSEHCYYMQVKEGGENVAVVITDDGVLMVNPPQPQDLPVVMEALAAKTLNPVRWVVMTEPEFMRNADTRFFAERNTLILTGARLQSLAPPVPASQQTSDNAAPVPARLIFEEQMRLFPSNVEVRILALKHKARTGGDVVVIVPAEKVLFAGSLYEAARYPDINAASGGDPVGWLDGMKEVIDAVPVFKSAIPAAKPATIQDKERTLEEGITVVSSSGDVSNLQNMKDLLDSCKKLRNEVSRAVKSGRTLARFLASSGTVSYWSFGNLESYAGQLFEALAK